MVDGNLDDAISAHPQQRGNEAMKASVQDETAQTLPAERPEGAAAVLYGLLGQPVADPVGDPRGEAAQPIVASRAIHPPASDGVPATEVSQQPRDVDRVVL